MGEEWGPGKVPGVGEEWGGGLGVGGIPGVGRVRENQEVGEVGEGEESVLSTRKVALVFWLWAGSAFFVFAF